MARRSRFCFLC
ncbi:hypothetical protein D044_4433A, partial [Vibrio parahaemolyticus EKP-026]